MGALSNLENPWPIEDGSYSKVYPFVPVWEVNLVIQLKNIVLDVFV